MSRVSRPALVGRALAAALVVAVLMEVAARVAMAATDVTPLEWHAYGAQLKVAQMDDRADADVVVVGTSMAQQDLVPSVLAPLLGDVEVYNASLDGGVPTVMEPWLLDQVVPRLHPETVLWGLSTLDLSLVYGDGIETAYAQAVATRSGLLASLDRAVSEVSTLVADRRYLRDPGRLFGAEADRAVADEEAARDELGADGERLGFEPAVTDARRREIAARLDPYVLDRDDLAAVIRTVEALDERGIDVVLVALPVPQRLLAQYPQGPSQHEVVGEAIRALGDELGVPVVDGIDAPDDDRFVDFTHLDAEGAAAFSRAVAAALP